MSIGQGNLSLESKSVKLTIGKLKNTTKFLPKSSSFSSGKTFVTFGPKTAETI